MVFTPRDQHFAFLSFVHFVIALGYVGGTYYLNKSTSINPIQVCRFAVVALLNAGVSIHGCATATKKWDSMTKERHTAVLYLNFVPIAFDVLFALKAVNLEIFGAAGILFCLNVLAIWIITKYLRTGVNPDSVDGHVDPTIYEVVGQWFEVRFREWAEITTQGYVGLVGMP